MKYWNKDNVFYSETKMGEINYVDLSNLKTKGSNIDWESVSNETIEFKYRDIVDSFNLDFNKECILTYKGNTVCMQVTNLKRVKLNKLVYQTNVRSFQDYKEHDYVKGCEILKVIKDNYKTFYLVYNIKEEVLGIIENQKLKEIKTNNYVPQDTVPVSKMLNNYSYIRPFVKHKQDLFNYRDTSTEYIDTVCPNCKLERKVRVADLVSPTFHCECQTYQSSFPERFVQATLDTLGIEYEREFKVKELGLKRFDFYLPKQDTFIEVNGLQHYQPTPFMDYETTIKSDKEKEIYCKNNNKRLIVIDARKSTYNWLFNSIEQYIKVDREKVIHKYNTTYR